MTVTDVTSADISWSENSFNKAAKFSERDIHASKIRIHDTNNISTASGISNEDNQNNNDFLNGYNSRSTPAMIHKTATFRPMTISPCIFHVGSRTTVSDIICTSNTTCITKQSQKHDSLTRHGKEAELPYETRMLLRTSESHLEAHARTPLDDQYDTTFRLMKNANMQREQMEFKYKLKRIKLDRYFVEKGACVKIQSSFRGYLARQRVRSIRIALGLSKSSDTKDNNMTAIEKDRRAVKAMGLSVPPDQIEFFYQDISNELFRSAFKLGLAPISGYTLHGNKFNNIRKFKSIEFDAAARIISRLVRGFLARRRFRKSVDEYVQKAKLESAKLVQRCYRSHLLQKVFEKDKQEYFRVAAIIIQKCFRGHYIRKKMYTVKSELARLKREETAAKTLQAIYRGKLFRRKLQEDLCNIFEPDSQDSEGYQPKLLKVVQMTEVTIKDQESNFDSQRHSIDSLWQVHDNEEIDNVKDKVQQEIHTNIDEKESDDNFDESIENISSDLANMKGYKSDESKEEISASTLNTQSLESNDEKPTSNDIKEERVATNTDEVSKANKNKIELNDNIEQTSSLDNGGNKAKENILDPSPGTAIPEGA